MRQALYRKWRPQRWDEVVGQQHVIQTLRNAVTGDHVMHAYLFSGPRGTGKTTVARLLAKAVNCLTEQAVDRPCNQCNHCTTVNENRFLDLIEIDAASNTSVEDVRDLRDKINFSPNQGQYKVYIIDEVHMLSTAAFNALLKTLEEPPPHAIFILATTEIHKIPATVLSRCQRHEFRRVPLKDIVSELDMIAKAEKLSAESEALTLIARQATGSLRDAISLLDQMASTGQNITLGLTQTILGTATSQTVLALIDAILNHQSAAGMEAIHTALDSGTDARVLARQVVEYLRALLLVQLGNEAQVEIPTETHQQVQRHAKSFSTQYVLHMVRSFNAAATDLHGGWQPSLPLELALAEVLETQDQPRETQAAKTSAIPIKSGEKVTDSQRVAVPPKEKATAVQSKISTQEQSISKEEKSSHKALDQEQSIQSSKSSKIDESSSSLEQISEAWKQIRAAIKPQNPALEALLNSCKLLEIKNGTLVLGFASDLLRSKADIPEQMEIARRAIFDAVGKDVLISCVVCNAKRTASNNVKVNGMVAAALKAGGEIVDIQE